MRFIHTIILLVTSATCFGQIGGKRSYEFLNLPVNARTSALGGLNVSLVENDGLLLINNPALSDSLNGGEMSISWLNYFADVNLTNANYVHKLKNGMKMHYGALFMDYGSFQGYDPTGLPTSNFEAKEYALVSGISHKLNAFTLGVNAKMVHSIFESFSSSALLFDIGGTFRPGSKGLTLAMVFKNVGWSLSDYTNANARVPFDLMFGTTFKPQYMPVRFSFTAYNLLRQNVVYYEQELNPNGSEPGIAEDIFRRLTLGTEILLSENFQARIGYNYRLRKELRLQNAAGGSGFSFGLMVRIKMFELSYARSNYHTAGGANQLTLSTNLKRFIGKENL